MASIQSKLFRILLRNRHLLKGHLRAPVINTATSLHKLREEVRISAAKMSTMPKGVQVSPANYHSFYAEWVVPQGCLEDRTILYFHGSGFVMGTSRDHRGLVAKFTERCGIKALVFDYSLAPEHPFPAAVHDSTAIYTWLLEQGYRPDNILFVGDSAGACIAFSTLLRMRDQGIPFPKAVVALSPCTDLTLSGESHRTRAKADPATPKGATETYTSYYIGDGDPSDPYMSPLFADFSGFPPTLIHVGTDETLLDDSVRFAQKLEEAGVDVHLKVWEGMFHCFPLLAPMFPEATEAMKEICGFIRTQLP